MTEENILFAQRFGFIEAKPIYDDFPQTGRLALTYLLDELCKKHFISYSSGVPYWEKILSEFNRTCRTKYEYDNQEDRYFDQLSVWIIEVSWLQIYSFCERVYSRLLSENATHDVDGSKKIIVPLDNVKAFYTNELNTIIAEENIGYYFINGQFQRRGRAQTQKSFQRIGSVLGGERFLNVRSQYNKARKFFEQFPEPDVQNCVKEALLALEACLSVVTGKPASKDFNKVVKQLMGKEDGDIPHPIGEGMIKLHAYRGSGKGVAHAATDGNKVTEVDAELVLNLTAAYITYLIDLFPEDEDEIPF